MPNTITSFFIPIAKTPARSSEMNQNFNNLRGDLIPINEFKQTASDLEHHLGRNGKYWLSGYAQSWDVPSQGMYLLSADQTFGAFRTQLTWVTASGGLQMDTQASQLGRHIAIGAKINPIRKDTNTAANIGGGIFSLTTHNVPIVFKTDMSVIINTSTTLNVTLYEGNFLSVTSARTVESLDWKINYANGTPMSGFFSVEWDFIDWTPGVTNTMYFFRYTLTGDFTYNFTGLKKGIYEL